MQKKPQTNKQKKLMMITLKRKLICVALEVLVKFFLFPKETRKQDCKKHSAVHSLGKMLNLTFLLQPLFGELFQGAHSPSNRDTGKA